MRSLLTTGLVAMATVLGTWAAGPAASAAPARTAIPGHAATPAISTATAAASTDLTDASCFHPGDCLAVGEHYTGAGKATPVAYKWNGSTWGATAVHLPSGASAGFLASVSCATGGCVAVGSYTGAGHELAEYFNGNSWTAGKQQPAGVSSAYTGILESVACRSSKECVADGYYVPSGSKTDTLAIAEVWNGSTWRLFKAPSEPYSNLDTVSCPAANYCILGGLYVNSTGSHVWAEKFTETSKGASWTALGVPQPTTPKAHFQYFNGVSCSSTANCAAVGVSVNSSDHASAFTEVLSGGVWQAPKIITWQSGQQSSLNAVACPAANYCIATGGDGPFTTLTDGRAAFATWNGSTWQQHVEPAPPHGDGNDLIGVQCASSAYCVLVGLEGKANTSTGVGLAGVLNGPAGSATSWTWRTVS